MKAVGKRSLISLLCVAAMALMGASTASAKGSSENPGNGAPPWGAAIHGDAQGVKLVGALYAEFYDLSPIAGGFEGKARVTVRLRKGSRVAVFYGEIPYNIVVTTASDVQQPLIDAVADQILNEFFPGQSLTSKNILVKDMSEYAQRDNVQAAATSCFSSYGIGNTFVITDIILAIK